MSGDVVASVEGVTRAFGGVAAVDGVSLDVGRGERIALIGPNGAGKSTLINLISGQVRPTSGRVFVGGADVTSMSVHRRAGLGVARSFQVSSLFPNLSVLDNALLGATTERRLRPAALRKDGRDMDALTRARALLERWGLWELRDELAREIAYGEQRRLEIVIALGSAPRLLLLDEPSAGLSEEESKALQRHMAELDADTGIVLVAHDMDLVFGFARRMVVLHEGKVLRDDLPRAIQGDPEVARIYMGVGPQ